MINPITRAVTCIECDRGLDEIDLNSGRVTCSACFRDGERRRALARYEALADPYPSMARWSFETYPRDIAGAATLHTVQEWVGLFDGDDYSEDDFRLNLWLHGPVGSGKTGAVWAALRWCIEEGLVGDFWNVRDLLAAARESFSSGEDDPLAGLAEPSLLVLDDLGAERPTEWALEQIAVLVERRYVGDVKQTIVTSNYSPSALIRRLGRVDQVAAQRLVSRLVESCTVVHVDGPGRRVP